MAEVEKAMQKWDEDVTSDTAPHPICHTVVWYHDESVFYAHDRQSIQWVHDTETEKPYAKGEGQSYMIDDFISADYGWLSSLDGSQTACVGLKPGANHDGYFSND